MNAATQQGPMRRKPILMPARTIEKVDRIARGRGVSFAEVVRDALEVYDGGNTELDDQLLEALADTMIQTTKDVVRKLEAVERRLDETHLLLQ
jgi:hypothetical protein